MADLKVDVGQSRSHLAGERRPYGLSPRSADCEPLRQPLDRHGETWRPGWRDREAPRASSRGRSSGEIRVPRDHIGHYRIEFPQVARNFEDPNGDVSRERDRAVEQHRGFGPAKQWGDLRVPNE